MLYTGSCVGTMEEMNEVVELLDMLGLRQEFSLEEVSGFVTSDSLVLGMVGGNSSMDGAGAKSSNAGFDDDEQVAVQESGEKIEDEIVKVDQYGDQEQFSFFIQEKFNNNHIITTNSSKPSVEKNNLQLAELRGQQVAAVRTCFFCPHCHMKFMRLKDKEMHSLVEHSYEQPFICQECGLRFKMKHELEQHMHHHGGGRSQIQCEVCDQVCKTLTQYFRHYKIHTGEKEFGCSNCGKSFSTATNLYKHKVVHGPKKYSCEDCGKKFHRKHNLKQHHENHHLQ